MTFLNSFSFFSIKSCLHFEVIIFLHISLDLLNDPILWIITQFVKRHLECYICVGYSELCESRLASPAIIQTAWHAIHSSNIFQHISSGAANWESSAPFGNQSAVTESYLCISRQRQVVAKWQVPSGSGKFGVWSCMSAPRREKCST